MRARAREGGRVRVRARARERACARAREGVRQRACACAREGGKSARKKGQSNGSSGREARPECVVLPRAPPPPPPPFPDSR